MEQNCYQEGKKWLTLSNQNMKGKKKKRFKFVVQNSQYPEHGLS